MAEITKIQWTDHTFNPWIGCTKVSPGCANCYAEKSTPSNFMGIKWGNGKARHRTSEGNWKKPVTWHNKAIREGARYRVFCASLCDVFDPEVPQQWRDDLWGLIERCSGLDWQLLTKRLNVLEVDELLEMLPAIWVKEGLPDHVWFGHSICTQAEAESVIPKMAGIPAKTRFLSMEPLLEPVPLQGLLQHNHGLIDWAIVGGESGPNARPFSIDWVASFLVDCRELNISPFVKQMGSNFVETKDVHSGTSKIILDDKKGGDINEWPNWCQTREMPVN